MEQRIDRQTGLWTRGAFLDALDDPGVPWASVASIDLDFLRQINDEHGHEAGNRGVRRTADLLRLGLPTTAIVARLGGDEFGVLCRSDAPDVVRWLETVNRLLVDIDELGLTFSAGVAPIRADDVRAEQLQRADVALLHAKAEGRGRVYLHGPLTELYERDRRDVLDRMRRLHADNVRLREQAFTDPITGLPNRRSLDWRLGSIPGEDLAVLFIDIDHFGDFNKEHGDSAGDAALRAVGECVAALVRGDDWTLAPDAEAYRKGGEEFVVLARTPDKQGGRALAERVRAAVEALGIPHEGCEPPVLTVTIGVSHMSESLGIQQAIDVAGRRAYGCKLSGRRNTVAGSDFGSDGLPA